MPATPRFAHNVYFELRDSSPAAQDRLIAACYDKLGGIECVDFLAAGPRDRELQRDVNDQGFDVALHVFFADRAAHDAYQNAPAHLEFIHDNQDNWRSVRVFDSTLVTNEPR